MSQELYQGFILLLIGMTTVGVVLMLIVIVGNLLIKLVNYFAPADTATKPKESIATIESKKIAAITSAIQIVSQGKAKIISIEKIKS